MSVHGLRGSRRPRSILTQLDKVTNSTHDQKAHANCLGNLHELSTVGYIEYVSLRFAEFCRSVLRCSIKVNVLSTLLVVDVSLAGTRQSKTLDMQDGGSYALCIC